MREVPAVYAEKQKQFRLGNSPTTVVGLKFKASSQATGFIVMKDPTLYKMWQLYDADRIKKAHAKQL